MADVLELMFFIGGYEDYVPGIRHDFFVSSLD